MNYKALLDGNGAFLEQLKSDEHLYLFSKHSASLIFQQLGAEYIQFETAIFSRYDMFFAVSREPFQFNDSKQIESNLLATPNGRQVLALLDMDIKNKALQKFNEAISANREIVLSQVHTLTEQVHTLTELMEKKLVKFSLILSNSFKHFAKKVFGSRDQ